MPHERRSEKRSRGIGLLRYTGTEVAKSKADYLTNFAISVNVSKSGISFLSLKPVRKNTSIRLTSERFWEAPRDGEVKWCAEVAPGSYRVGVELMKNQPV